MRNRAPNGSSGARAHVVDGRIRTLQEYANAGFDTVFVNQTGPDQRGFFGFYRTKVLPWLTS